MSHNQPVVEAKDLWRSYRRGAEEIHALASFSLEICSGEMVAIVGRSGSGKTTFLNQVGCLDRPTRGSLKIAGVEVTQLDERQLIAFRRDYIGFIFQLFYLIPTLTVYENVELPLVFARRRSRERVMEALERVGLTDKTNLLPSQLSGGDMQRVAIARALMNAPRLLLADEPTGRLERHAKRKVLDLFHQLKHDGLAIIVATHDLAQAKEADRIVELRDGRIVQRGEAESLLASERA